MRHWIVLFTLLLLTIDTALAVVWSITQEPRYEPWITTLALVATITGLVIDRWLAERERRAGLLCAMCYEVGENRRHFQLGAFEPDEPAVGPKAYPRLTSASFDGAVISGAFSSKKDQRFFYDIVLYKRYCSMSNFNIDSIQNVMNTVNPFLSGAPREAFFATMQASVLTAGVTPSLPSLQEELLRKIFDELSKIGVGEKQLPFILAGYLGKRTQPDGR